MLQLARVFGFQLLVAGTFILAFPEAARGLMQARAEFARLSPGALRLIGGLELFTGALLVWLSTTPAVVARAGEFVLPGRRVTA